MSGRRSRRIQRGALALVLAIVLFVAMALTLVLSQRGLLVEQRNAAQHERSVQAFAAAEAGVDWAIAQLNANRRIDADCVSSVDPLAESFRSRTLRIDGDSGAIAVRPGLPAPVAACAHGSGGWQCQCPGTGTAPTALPADATAGFSIGWAPAARNGTIRLVSTGCTRPGGICTAAASGTVASARVEVTLALLPALPAPPAAAVTLGGDFDAGSAAVDLRNLDPASGGLLDAGGTIRAPLARRTVPPGDVAADAWVDRDPGLAGLAADRFFARYFALPPTGWARAQSALPIVCPSDCGDALASEIAAAADATIVRVEGDLSITGPRRFGTPERPLLLVVGGRVSFDGAVEIHGVVQAGSMRWHGGGGGVVRGALLLAADYQGDAAATLVRDAGVLDRLKRATGPLVQVSGSWHDF